MRKSNIADELRRAVSKSGMTQYRIAKRSGVEPAVISKFMRGLKGIQLDTAARIVAGLGKRFTDRKFDSAGPPVDGLGRGVSGHAGD